MCTAGGTICESRSSSCFASTRTSRSSGRRHLPHESPPPLSMLVSLQCAHTVYARVRTCDEMNHRDGLTRSVQPCYALRSLYLFCFVNGVSSTSLYESVRRSKIGRRAICSVALQCHCCLARSPAGSVCMHPAMLCCVVSACLHFVECRVDRVWVCVRRHYRPGHRRADGVRVRAAACALSAGATLAPLCDTHTYE